MIHYYRGNVRVATFVTVYTSYVLFSENQYYECKTLHLFLISHHCSNVTVYIFALTLVFLSSTNLYYIFYYGLIKNLLHFLKYNSSI